VREIVIPVRVEESEGEREGGGGRLGSFPSPFLEHRGTGTQHIDFLLEEYR